MLTRRKALITLGSTVLWLGAVTLTGCGGGNSGTRNTVLTGTGNTTRATGNVQVSIVWPSADSRYIPQYATAVRLRLTTYNVPFADGSYVREITVPRGQQPGTITGVPVGEVKIEVLALRVDESGVEQRLAVANSQVVTIIEGDNSIAFNLQPATLLIGAVSRLPADGSAPVPVPLFLGRDSFYVDSGAVYEITLSPGVETYRVQSGENRQRVPLDIPASALTVRGEYNSTIRVSSVLLDENNNEIPENVVTGATRVRIRFTSEETYAAASFQIEVPEGYLFPSTAPDRAYRYYMTVYFNVPPPVFP